jgi:hypothetical protein
MALRLRIRDRHYDRHTDQNFVSLMGPPLG